MRTLSLLVLLAGCGDTAQKPAEPDHTEKAAAFEPSLDAPADVAKAPEDAKKTESGLMYKVLHAGPGTGGHPDDTSRVEVHYTGWTTDGERFDSSRERGKPASFGLRQVIAGWTEGLQLMQPGDHVRFWIPEELAYKGRPGKPAGMLVFDVELISFKTPPKPPEAPADVAEAPADAQKTDSGLAYKVLKKGAGGEKPTSASMAVVHYAGWTTDGKNFDFSRKRGDTPAAFGVGAVIPGWTEGLQLMESGDSYRFWIPEELAYKGKRGPQGMLVFDVDLIDVVQPPEMTPPADVQKTESGLQYKLLSAPATAAGKAPDGARLKMNWIGWSADKGGFDSNLGREPGHPAGQMRMLKGLKEAAHMLNKGEKARFWIPQDLAFAGRPGAPEGTIVYDLELIDFELIKPPNHPTPGAKPAEPQKKDEHGH